MSERHRGDHEVHHVTSDLAAWSRSNVRRMASVAADHDIALASEADRPGYLCQVGETRASMVGRRPEPALLLLLEDLRTLYLMGSENSLGWEVLKSLSPQALTSL